jgi:hypothetical protein
MSDERFAECIVLFLVLGFIALIAIYGYLYFLR